MWSAAGQRRTGEMTSLSAVGRLAGWFGASRIALWGVCWVLLGAGGVSSARAEELRDPFVFGPRTDTSGGTGATLIGVLWDPTHPLALVGEQTVAIGDLVTGWQVVEIRADGIVIQRGERREFLAPGHAIPQ